MRATTIEVPNTFAPALQFQVKDGQNTRVYEGIRRVEGPNARDQSVLSIPFILSRSPNECWLHTCDAFVITTCRLGLQAPFVARNYFIVINKEKTKEINVYECLYIW